MADKTETTIIPSNVQVNGKRNKWSAKKAQMSTIIMNEMNTSEAKSFENNGQSFQTF